MGHTIVAQKYLASWWDPQPNSLPQTKSKQPKLALEGLRFVQFSMLYSLLRMTDDFTTRLKLGDAPSGCKDMLQPSAGTMGRPQHTWQSSRT